MADPGLLTRGLSVPAALHGASRRRGRKQAITSIAKADRDRYLVERRVTLRGGMDEAPQAYKNLVEVMVAQADLGAVLGRFDRRHASCEWPTSMAHVTTHRLMRLKRVTKGSPAAS